MGGVNSVPGGTVDGSAADRQVFTFRLQGRPFMDGGGPGRGYKGSMARIMSRLGLTDKAGLSIPRGASEAPQGLEA
jgi:hypothetical protein